MARKKPIVALDGPAGSGKSTVARLVAEKLGFFYLDTGAMYRAVALKSLRESINCDDEPALTRLAQEAHIQMVPRPSLPPAVFLDGEEVTEPIRSAQVAERASWISQYQGVRDALVKRQKMLVEPGGVVVEGRDAQTVIAPDAEVKIFLTASLEERARRRWLELRQRGEEISFEQVVAQTAERDQRDQDRSVSPLRKADDAVELDTTNLTAEEAAEIIVRMVKEREHQMATKGEDL
ncbi:MAG: (d)CMP kinase [Armatimonadetes bacterium]|nr:(d)CMP kinase [Armatimonadota bacterium]MDW8121206.1 (d)CMP kinase [Armatimonadota bacterium]